VAGLGVALAGEAPVPPGGGGLGVTHAIAVHGVLLRLVFFNIDDGDIGRFT